MAQAMLDGGKSHGVDFIEDLRESIVMDYEEGSGPLGREQTGRRVCAAPT